MNGEPGEPLRRDPILHMEKAGVSENRGLAPEKHSDKPAFHPIKRG
jgi:hypothetical protein